MTPRERVLSAMDLGTPDRVPVMCQMSIGHMLLQLGVSPVEFWHDVRVFAKGLVRLREVYSFDGILVSLHGHDPDWASKIKSREKTEDGELVSWENGERLVYPPDDLPRPLVNAPPHRKTIHEIQESDLPQVLDYIPVSQGLHFRIHPQHKFDILDLVRREAGESYSLHGEVTSPFDYFLDFFGLQEGLVNLIETPERSEWILSRFALLVSQLASEMCGRGVDAIKISSPFAGAGFISPDFYEQFVLPGEAEIAHAVRQKNVCVYTHTCGKIDDRLELMLESGVNGIECLDPPPLGNVELEDAKERLKGKAFIKGNIDSVNTLLTKTSIEILEDARHRIEIGNDGGGFILSTACSVAPHVGRDKLCLIHEAVELWGS